MHSLSLPSPPSQKGKGAGASPPPRSSTPNRSKRLDIISKYYGKTLKRFLLADKRECLNKYACCKNYKMLQWQRFSRKILSK